MYSVRNNWAHVSAELPGKDSIIHDVEILIRFFEQMHDGEAVEELHHFKNTVEMPESTAAKAAPPAAPSKLETTPEATEKKDPLIEEKSLVYIVGDPDQKGMVFSVSSLGGTKKYEVFIDGTLKTFYEGQIALAADHPDYEWVDSDTMRSYLTAYQINNPSASNLYSLNSARIDFVPYQFRPALKMIKSDEPRILIADSVGVGKTIEAGLIIKELQARSDLENIMIICPKPLIADRKWENEMKRFDEEFIPLDGETLRQIISDTDRDGEWPSRYGKTIVPYSILDSRTYLGDESKKHRTFGLSNLDPAPHFDLIIIDEYEIIGLNLKSQLNQGFRGLVLFLLTLKIADKAIHRRQYAQNRNLSAERGAASLCSASTRHTLPTYISFRRSTELSACVDLHRLPLRHSTHVPVARAA